jgi:sugar lactone lactonase YvrE
MLKCLAPVGDHCGEATTWSPEEQALYWVDINRFLIHRWDHQSQSVKTWQFDEPCVALGLTDQPGVLLLGLGSGVIAWEPEGDVRHPPIFMLDGWPRSRLNDGRPGPDGALWIGSMANNVLSDGAVGSCDGFHGTLFRVARDAPVTQHKQDIGISNTVCFSPDHRHFYFGDSLRNIINRHDYDAASGTIANEMPFFDGFDRGVPDGSAVDSEGYLWNCRFGGGCIVRVAPDGTIDRIAEMPVSNITTCDFGGPDLRTLFITTASAELDHHERLAGSLFALKVETPGLPAFRYKL